MDAWSIAVVMAVMHVHVTGANFNNEPRQEFFHLHPLCMSIPTIVGIRL